LALRRCCEPAEDRRAIYGKAEANMKNFFI